MYLPDWFQGVVQVCFDSKFVSRRTVVSDGRIGDVIDMTE